ncbi:SDR family NAD(P)-dependent oxidoreductase [Pseudonocardia eucalypti]|uniref:SDR family NAD(P)-dependent oxidoreductase n=1 Tax=Pseudonocardia eucalypti TaxID=648755 RepID=A0ABP9QRZ6_9PSEU|nr:3-oxoacyl-[acyl-carrier protein] reductase [Pseudonocardia eucalypti]
MGLLGGRTALVVGGTGGIGRAIASAYRDEGAAVVVADRSVASATDDAVPVEVDDEGSVASAVRAAADRVGPLDILVNSAGILTESPLVDMDTATWDRTLAVDLTGVFLCCRAVLPGMLDRGWGRIINIASQLGIKGGVGLAHYAAAKAGVIGLTKSLALEVSARGVLVNAIAPGPIETAMVAGITEDWKRAKRAELPLGRFGRPSEVAPTAVLLASDPGGNLYVGQTLGPNSGDVMP